jgi:hypothetical protein
MVTVVGGRVDVDYTATLNCPTLTGATLIGQTGAAILYDGLEAASVVGAVIKPAAGALAVQVSSGPTSHWGEMSFIDCIIDYGSGSSPDTR